MSGVVFRESDKADFLDDGVVVCVVIFFLRRFGRLLLNLEGFVVF